MAAVVTSGLGYIPVLGHFFAKVLNIFSIRSMYHIGEYPLLLDHSNLPCNAKILNPFYLDQAPNRHTGHFFRILFVLFNQKLN